MIKIVRPERSELLMPAGDLERMKAAILYGADAVYCGTPDMSLRTKSGLNLDELVEGIEYAHSKGKKVYLTLNLFTHNKDIEKLPLYIETIRKVKPDGLIIADPAVFQFVKENAPELELHISTQANICSWLSVDYWAKQGASLAVLAREVSFNELKEIREKCPDIKIEAFVHGAMCMTYSGRCLLSNFMAERGSNQGNCAHSCRWKYKVHIKKADGNVEEVEVDRNDKNTQFFLEEEGRKGQFMEIMEDEKGSYILNSKDLCLMPKLDDYLKLGVDSLKVEGRHKNIYYASFVARTYRRAIDDYYANPASWNHKPYMDELYKIRNRGYTMAFHDGRLNNISHDYDTTASMGEWNFGGIIREWHDDGFVFEVRNEILAGQKLYFLPPPSKHWVSLEPIILKMDEFVDAKTGKVLEKVSAGQGFAIKILKSQFNGEDQSLLEEIMPVLTVARVENNNTLNAEPTKLKERKVEQQFENNEVSAQKLELARKMSDEHTTCLCKKTQDTQVKQEPSLKPLKSVCCGRGCNGCAVFWNDPKYERARTELKKRRQGTKFSKEEAEVLKQN